MNKRYQVFVSSTYADLKDERQKVIQTLMEMDCIPAGMELFPAADEEQWNFIQTVIDDCDYYILIIGARYGSLSDDGISYTQKEYEYAIESGLKVLAFIHSAPEDLPASKGESTPELREKLDQFREHVKTNRLVKFWTDAKELPGLVSLSLSKTIKMYPAVGWIRGDAAASAESLQEINELRKSNDSLRSKISDLKHSEVPENLNIASLNEDFKIRYSWMYSTRYGSETSKKEVEWTWEKIFSSIAPALAEHPSDMSANKTLAGAIYRIERSSTSVPASIKIHPDDFDTIRVQLETHGLISTNYNKTTKGSMALFWKITSKGTSQMLQSRIVRSAE